MRLIFLFLIFSLWIIQPVFSQTIYFPGKMEASFRNKINRCESKSISQFEYKQLDFYQESLRRTLSKMSKRSKLEGKTRTDSIRCLLNLNLNTQEKILVSGSLQDLFEVEIQLYQTYLRWIQSGLGLDAKLLESYFQSRYDLMVLIQIKTLTVWKLDDPQDLSEVESDFSNLYQSVHRSYFDAIYGLDPRVRDRYFQIKEGRKQ